MKVVPKQGVDQLLFGMKQANVSALYGAPNKQYEDEDGNIIYLYNQQKWRLTFYEDEDFRLGYIVLSSPNLELYDKKIIGQKVTAIKEILTQKGYKTWTNESFDVYENYFNEDNWIILQTEFDEIVKVEIGAKINNDDTFEWKF
jgi:hypothetical protein